MTTLIRNQYNLPEPQGSRPKVGDTIYIDTALYIDHGEDDIAGGKAIISEIIISMSAGISTWFITVKEVPGKLYNYPMLLEKQVKLKKRFGEETAHLDPDYGESW